jgi:metal-responsive CopG/Arc/MetJ family transcriptional regulator
MPMIRISFSDKDLEILDGIANEIMQARVDVIRNMLRLGLTQYREYLDSEKGKPGFFTKLVLGTKENPARVSRSHTYQGDDYLLSLERQLGIYREDTMSAFTEYTPQKEGDNGSF